MVDVEVAQWDWMPRSKADRTGDRGRVEQDKKVRMGLLQTEVLRCALLDYLYVLCF